MSAFKTDSRTLLIEKVVRWLHDTDNFRQHLIVNDPSIAFAAKIDAWDQKKLQYGFSNTDQPELGMPDSSIYIWDAHFSQNEGRISAAKILNNQHFELIAFFQPEFSFKVLGGYDYNIMIFRKVNARRKDNFDVLNELKTKQSEPKLLYSNFYDFENSVPEKVKDKFRIASDDSIPNFYYQLGDESEFSPSVLLTDHDLELSSHLEFKVSFDFYPDEPLSSKDAIMVFSVEKHNKPYFYLSEDLFPFIIGYNKWNRAIYQFSIPGQVESKSSIKLYIWDTQKKKLKVDNFKIEVYSNSLD